MRIFCFADSLNGGGAQRQLCNIAIGLAGRGFEVIFVVIHPLYHFRPRLTRAGIEVVCLRGGNPLTRLVSFMSLLRAYRPDAVLSFLRQPNLLSALAAVLYYPRRFRVVVSERGNPPGRSELSELLRLRVLTQADALVFNSKEAARAYAAKSPRITARARVVYNLVDEGVAPLPAHHYAVPVIAVAANYRPEKNILAVIRVAGVLAGEGRRFLIRWYGNNFYDGGGRPTEQSATYLEAVAEVGRLGLSHCIELHGFEGDPQTLYGDADAVLLSSLHEGFPNTVCEALTCGKVILCSAVSDLPLWIKHPDNGWVFQPTDLAGMKSAIEWLLGLGQEDKDRIGSNNMKLASELFDRERILDAYSALLKGDP